MYPYATALEDAFYCDMLRFITESLERRHKKPGIDTGLQRIFSSVLFFRFDPVLLAFLTRGLNHFFSNQDLIPVFIDNGAAQLRLGLGPYHGFLIAAVLQAHGLSPHQVVRFRLSTLDDHAMTSLDASSVP